MNIKDKYALYREQAASGDVILYRGTGIVSRGIQWADKAYYNHTGAIEVIDTGNGKKRLLTIDAWVKKVEPCALSARLLANGYTDFCVIRKKNLTPNQLDRGLSFLWMTIEHKTKYDYSLFKRCLFEKKFNGLMKIGFINKWVKGLGKENAYICSELMQDFMTAIGIHAYSDKGESFTPQDLIRYMNHQECSLLFNDKII